MKKLMLSALSVLVLASAAQAGVPRMPIIRPIPQPLPPVYPRAELICRDTNMHAGFTIGLIEVKIYSTRGFNPLMKVARVTQQTMEVPPAGFEGNVLGVYNVNSMPKQGGGVVLRDDRTGFLLDLDLAYMPNKSAYPYYGTLNFYHPTSKTYLAVPMACRRN